MNKFRKQLEQSQADADLHRWEYAYHTYLSTMYDEVNEITNTDTLPDGKVWQLKGVDHIVECDGNDVYIDFMLREKTYDDFFLEYEVSGKPGKFGDKPIVRVDTVAEYMILTQYIAYSYRQSPSVFLFPFNQARRMMKDLLASEKQLFRHKTSVSVEGGQKWQTKGIIVPHSYAFQHMDVTRIDM